MTARAPAAGERWPGTGKACGQLAERVVKALTAAGYPDAADPARDRQAAAFAVTADPLGVTIDAELPPADLTPATERDRAAFAITQFRIALRKAGLRPQLAGGHLLLQSPKPVLWNGRRVKARTLQMRYWAAIIGLLGVGLIAGLYYALWQVHWTFGFLGFDWSLKRWWDAGTWWPAFLGHWDDYRHGGFRDQFEPAVATVLILALLAPAKYWGRRVSAVNLAARLVALLVAGVVLGCLGVYLRDFGAPYAWARGASAAGRPGFTMDGWFAWAGHLSLFTLAWGALMGFVLHMLWGPAGATIQGYWTDRLADRGRDRNHVPLYVRLPLAPPVNRELYSWLYKRPEIDLAKPGRSSRWLLASITVFVVLLIALGLLAKYYIAHGHTVPYLAPGQATPTP